MAFGEIFLAGAVGSPERARWLHLARSGSQSQRAIWVILPARRASHIINKIIGHVPNVLAGILTSLTSNRGRKEST